MGHDRSVHHWYDDNAASYAEATAALLPLAALERFIEALAAGTNGARLFDVLDAGCGSGRDTAWLLSRGHRVDAIDASERLCAEARQRFGVDARVMSFFELEASARYDGVWASASLVHLGRDDAVRALRSLGATLRPGGVVYASVKEGTGEGLDRMGRFFRYWTQDDLLAAISEAMPTAHVLETWTNRPTLDISGAGFLNVIARL